MKTNMKKHVKAWLAAFLTLAIVLQMFAGVGAGSKAEAADTGYTEMTFGDWGISEGGTPFNNAYSLTDPTAISSLDGVAINGTIDLNGSTSPISFGGTETGKGEGFWLANIGAWGAATVLNGGFKDQWASMTSNSALCLTDGEVYFRITFDKADNANDWTINMYAEGLPVYSKTYTNLTLGLYIGIPANVTVTSKQKIDYTEMKFSDWGIYEGDSYDCNIYTLSDSGKTETLKNVAISGNVNFNGDGTALLRVGGTEDARHGGFCLTTNTDGTLVLWPQEIGNSVGAQTVLDATTWASLFTQAFDLRMEFTQNSSNEWMVEIYINDESKGQFNCGTATPGLYFAKKGVTVEGFYDYIYVNMASEPNGYCIDKTDGIINDVAVHKGNYYNQLGEHTLEYTDNGSEVAQKLILFIPGDTNLDGNVGVVDLVRMKRHMQGTATTALNMASKKAADLYVDDVLKDNDTEVLRQLVLTYEPQTSETGIHYGLGEPVSNLGVGEVPYASSEFVSSLAGAYGVDTFRIWLPCIGTATSNQDGSYSVTLNPTLLAELKELVARLQLNGVEQIVALPYPIIPDNFPKYIGKNGQYYTQQDMDAGTVTNDDLVRMEYYAFPEWEDGTNYATFMNVQTEYFKLLAQEVPGITHYEGINEPENPWTVIIHKFGYLEDEERAKLTVSYPANSTFVYNMAQIARVTVDFCHAITDGIEAAGSDAKVLSSGLTVLTDSIDYLEEAYAYINASDNYYRDADPDNYFEIVNWHPYVTDTFAYYNDGWVNGWLSIQNELYAVVQANHGSDVPVWLTELGASDYGTMSGPSGRSAECAYLLKRMIELAEANLPYVDTIIAFRLFDKLDSQQETDQTDAGQDNYGMIEDFNNTTSGAVALKPYGKTFFDIMKPHLAGDYSAVTRVVDKYYNIYKGTYALDQSDDFESAIVKGNALVTNHSDIDVTYTTYAGYMLPTLSLIEDGDSTSIAYDYSSEGVTTQLGHVIFNFGRLEAGTYKFTFDIDSEGKTGRSCFGITTEPTWQWANHLLNSQVEYYSWDDTVIANEFTVTFTVSKTLENAAFVFQTNGTGEFRISFDNIELTKTN